MVKLRSSCLILLPLFPLTCPATSVADLKPPAGQVCSAGAYVVGFDREGNILCSEPRPDDGPASGTIGEGPETPSAVVNAAAPVAADSQKSPTANGAPAAVASGGATAGARLMATGPEPWSVVYGKRDVTVTINGSGFTTDTRVIFNGQSHAPAVDPNGSELRVTLDTSGLAIGKYPITVSNGPGDEITLERRLVVY
jgi:hypothetical protein